MASSSDVMHYRKKLEPPSLLKKAFYLFSDLRCSPTCLKLLLFFLLVLGISGICFTGIAISLLGEMGSHAASVNEKNIKNNVESFLLANIYEQSQ